MSEYSGPLPVPTPETRPFWEAARRHELSLQRCRACGAYVFYPRAACPRCLGPDLEWRRVSGRGRLHTFTVVHRGARSFPLPAPYALADAGLAKDQVDAVFSAGLWMGSETAEYLGIRPRYIDGTQIGGCSFIAHVEHAMAAIAAGLCEVALITHGESGASRIGMPGTRFAPDSWRLQFEQPFGLAGPPTGYALAAARHARQGEPDARRRALGGGAHGGRARLRDGGGHVRGRRRGPGLRRFHHRADHGPRGARLLQGRRGRRIRRRPAHRAGRRLPDE